ncbi:hypothetical protein E3D03_008425 [Paracoccus sp. DMF]|nr:hypothetical protein [Paracoccus sp. DMF]
MRQAWNLHEILLGKICCRKTFTNSCDRATVIGGRPRPLSPHEAN